ncbi:MAG: sigma-70 family RNA polymerase sigma factor [Oscillospiraceae bacterium]|nr:sigma-70 family RNA polymerase sigma factor [Oscillospiraceae bacterium]
MEDEKIIELYFERKESAITETALKYGNYLYKIAYNILLNNEDSEESVNDTYLGAWNAVPPEKPRIFSAFLSKITRYISLNKWRSKKTEKRGSGEVDLAFEEIEECVPSNNSVIEEIETKELAKMISYFLKKLPETERVIFIRRYYYFDSVSDICKKFGFSKSKISTLLCRTRKKILSFLEKEGMLDERR